MPSVLRHTDCPACGHRHNFCLAVGEVTPGQSYDYLCPENSTKGTLRPTTPAEVMNAAPQGAVALAPAMATSAVGPDGPSEPNPSPARLQELLGEVKDVAGKVGGMDRLASLVETLKAAQE